MVIPGIYYSTLGTPLITKTIYMVPLEVTEWTLCTAIPTALVTTHTQSFISMSSRGIEQTHSGPNPLIQRGQHTHSRPSNELPSKSVTNSSETSKTIPERTEFLFSHLAGHRAG